MIGGEAWLRMVQEGEAYLVLLPIYVALLGGERVAHAVRRPGHRWNDRDAASNLAITVLFLLLDVGIGWLLPVALLGLVHAHLRVFTLGFDAGSWLLAFVLYDLAWYVDHRIAHRTGLFWAFHQVHHSSNEFNTTVASRGFLLDNTLLPRPVFYGLGVLGVSPLHYIVVKIVTSVWGIAQHTRLVGRLGWLDLVLATPSSHRVHHGSDPAYLDRNYGEVLLVWDHLFGTFARERAEPTYGLTEPLQRYDLLSIQLSGIAGLAAKWRRARTWAERLQVLVRPPEWRPGETAAPAPR